MVSGTISTHVLRTPLFPVVGLADHEDKCRNLPLADEPGMPCEGLSNVQGLESPFITFADKLYTGNEILLKGVGKR